jgi:endonuclease/exonuclease/phosphatase (EEP) superfamily protein YafD
MTSDRWRLAGRIASWSATVTGSTLVTVTLVDDITAGLLALAAILLPHLLLMAIAVAAAGTALDRGRWSVLSLVLLVIVAGVRLGPDWLSLPSPPPGDRSITMVSWNLEVGSRVPATMVEVILDHDVDVVALQELTVETAAILERDPRIRAHYPHRLLSPEAIGFRLGILSRYPVMASEATSTPQMLSATLDVGQGARLRVLNAHPMRGSIRTATRFRVPVGFDAAERDASLRAVRQRIDDLLASDMPLVVLGDFNVTPTEPAYRALSTGLRDVHREVGLGPGWTWRPTRLAGLGLRLGLLRIDYVFAGPGITPTSIAVDCAHPGDHCVLRASLELPRPR